MANFPLELQQKMNESGFSFKIGATALRSNMDVGPEKVRRRFTKSVDTTSLTIDLEYSDYQVFYDFYNTTLNGGVDSFTFNNPFTQTSVDYRFVSPPQISSKGGNWFTVTMTWEQLP